MSDCSLSGLDVLNTTSNEFQRLHSGMIVSQIGEKLGALQITAAASERSRQLTRLASNMTLARSKLCHTAKDMLLLDGNSWQVRLPWLTGMVEIQLPRNDLEGDERPLAPAVFHEALHHWPRRGNEFTDTFYS